MKKHFILFFLNLFYLLSIAQTDSVPVYQIEIDTFTIDSSSISRSFYSNGNIKSEGKFIKKHMWFWWKGLIKISVEDSLWSYYYENDKLKKRGTYDKGKKNGLWEFFNKEGKLYRVELYEKNKLIDKRIYIREPPLWEQVPDVKGKFIAN